jgi:5'-nucleotidase
VSGVNHGSNSSINVIYSGTMSAAVEAGLKEFQQWLSLLDFEWNADFETMKFIRKITLEVLENRLPKVVLNVNFPKLTKDNIKGIKICRQAKARWIENLINDKHHRKITIGLPEFVNQDKGEDTDEWALGNGYVSVVPVQFDLTAHHAATQHLEMDR